MDILGKFIDLLAKATGELPDSDRRKIFEALHRALVIIDDCICDLFGFSRKPRGKHTIDK